MAQYEDLVQQWRARDMRLLRIFLDLHTACLNGVTAREAAEWLEMPAGKASETSVGIMLKQLGYCRYRKQGTYPHEEQRLFPEGKAPPNWTRK